MNGFLLDTNVPSELVRPHPDQRVRAWLAAQHLDALFISAVSFGELRKGIELRDPGKRRAELEAWLNQDLTAQFVGRILPLTRAVADRWGVLDAQRQRSGRPLNAPDGDPPACDLLSEIVPWPPSVSEPRASAGGLCATGQPSPCLN